MDFAPDPGIPRIPQKSEQKVDSAETPVILITKPFGCDHVPGYMVTAKGFRDEDDRGFCRIHFLLRFLRNSWNSWIRREIH